ncbi:MAG: UbiA family prenyltransferase [Calothrix sp. SM1_5_4]|nr:UbiA family prenyltransferase [Calothrix sp. SM1_5_4]
MGPVAAHRLHELPVLVTSGVAFLAMGLTASAVYIINDIADLERDRQHPTKRNRPLARGAMNLPTAIGAIALLLGSAAALAATVDRFEILWAYLLSYLVINIAYSGRLKRVHGLDIVILSVLYTLRVRLGADVNGIPVSNWFGAFFIFSFCGTCLCEALQRTSSGRGRREDQAGLQKSRYGSDPGDRSGCLFGFDGDLRSVYRKLGGPSAVQECGSSLDGRALHAHRFFKALGFGQSGRDRQGSRGVRA